MELKFVGGVYGGNVKPSPFLCLILKMLQIQPEKDIVVEFIRNEDFKYVRALGAFYMRLTGTSMDCYKYLEPLYYDYRKMRIMNRNGKFELTHMDEYIDGLLRDERTCDVILPRIQKRNVLEESNQLDPRVSAVEEDIEEMESDEEEEELPREVRRSPTPEKRSHKDTERSNPVPVSKRSRSRSPHKRDRHGKTRDTKARSRSREREKRHRSPGKRHREEEDRKRKSRKGRNNRDRQEADKERHRDRSNREKSDRERDRERRHRDHGKSRSHHSRLQDADIREANELRSKLGMAPLRP
ncbi:hypothetical protein C0Q70_17226 [Pomacea canaliculata]|uniref:Pre-mRNA-splicing factor 38 n=2 Tax=Pomacea canaliculata TaxID=400727 RepID=A0A2T7NS03_POMCA|nr:hypothetical protein C0Q70_17226 [Pomacea canaliculata]